MDATTPTARPEIHPRNIDFGLTADLPRHWHSDDPYITHFFNGLSLMFPDGERFFMDSVRHFQDRITDPKLRADVRGFLGQEGMHGREHHHYNEVLEAQGYPARTLVKLVQRGIWVDRKTGAKWQLAMTCGLEHFTAIFADAMLRDPSMFADAHPVYARLWRWHAMEETEHKAVAYDVYQAVAPGLVGYLRRVIVMMLVTVLFFIEIVTHQLVLVHRDGMLWNLRSRRKAFRFFWTEPGFIRRGMPAYLQYYRRDFHPWQIDNSDLVERYQAEYA